MELNDFERYQHLLTHINLPETALAQYPELTTGQIKKVDVFPEEEQWHIYLSFSKPISIYAYDLLLKQLSYTFEPIAHISLMIHTDDLSEHLLYFQDYWKWILHNPKLHSHYLFLKTLSQCPWEIKDQHLIFYVPIPSLVTQSFNHNWSGQLQQLFAQFSFFFSKISFELKEVHEIEYNKPIDEIPLKSKNTNKRSTSPPSPKKNRQQDVIFGKKLSQTEPTVLMSDIQEEERSIAIEGSIFDIEIRPLKSGRKLLLLKITDYTSSFLLKKFLTEQEEPAVLELQKGMWVKARGSIQEDNFLQDLIMNVHDLVKVSRKKRIDDYSDDPYQKRIELHAHTNMSTMDAITPAKELIAQAADWGHRAIAITDHENVQAFPEAYEAAQKHDIHVIYGLEAQVVDDGVPIVYHPTHINLSEATYVVFDVETTGLSAVYHQIIELAAVKMYKGNIIDRFEAFINPGHKLSPETIQLTGITDDMLKDADSEVDVLKRFIEFSTDSILVAHNASFDIGFLNQAYLKHQLPETELPVIDTLELSRFLNPDVKSHRLNTLCKKYHIPLEHHHRAIYDAEATAQLAWILIQEAIQEHEITHHNMFTEHIGLEDTYKRARPFHVTILTKTQAGLKNLFKLVSLSNIDYFYRVPRIPRSILVQYREGLLLGSACQQGELFELMMQKGYEAAKERASFYDFIEIMPPEVYGNLMAKGLIQTPDDLLNILTKLVQMGHELNIPVIATGNVHYLNPEEKIYREILVHSLGEGNPLNRSPLPDVYFRTTQEMLEAFHFLDEKIAKEVVIEAPHQLISSIETIEPIKKDLYTPKIPGAEEQIRTLSYKKAHEYYGDPLPDMVQARLEKELDSIIGNGFSVIYLISQKLVEKSLHDGYLVGSRGSVGSSFVATMTGITEVNPLPPHYRCPKCCYTEFFEDGSYGSGYDLPQKNCPKCDAVLYKDGQDIPFETFLGFHGDKVPDIDLSATRCLLKR